MVKVKKRKRQFTALALRWLNRRKGLKGYEVKQKRLECLGEKNPSCSERDSGTGNEWISCQADANKLVQPGSRTIDEDYFPEDERPLPEENASPETNQPGLPKETLPDFPEEIQPGTPQEMKQLFSEELQAVLKKIPNTENDFNHDDKAEIVTDDEWVIKKQLCRCCLAEGTFDDSLSSRAAEADGITYDDILNSFRIELFPVGPESGGALRGVCGLCAARMRDAHAFCQQVHASDAHFRALYARNCITVANTVFDDELKHEPESDADADDNFVPETKEDAPEPQFKASKPRARKSQRLQKSPKKKQADVILSGPSKKPLRSRKRKKSPPPTALIKYLKTGDLYKCTRCDFTRPHSKLVLAHFSYTHQDRYKCIHCENGFKKRTQLIAHKLQEHNIDERLACGACDAKFNVKHQLSKHVNNYHKMGELKKCPKCDYESYSYLHLKKHMVKHETSKDHCCKYCKKSFLRRTNLQLHERIHTGDKRKVCAECGQAFVQKASLNYHMAKYHPGVKF